MRLQPISVEFLSEGMTANEDIFGSIEGVAALVKKNTVFSNAMIERLKLQLNVAKNIYVTESTYKMLISNGLPKSMNQHAIEKRIGYGLTKESIKSFVTKVEETGLIEIDEAVKTAKIIEQKINLADKSLILQCINGVRDLDEYLYTHCLNVSLLNGLMGKWLELTDKEIEQVTLVGLLHDVGKTKTPPEILQKPGKLNEEEFAIMKRHSSDGYNILIESGIIDKEVLDGVIEHHEKINGQGYPKGIREISLFGRITAVSDVYDAMVAKRVYKSEASPFTVLSEFAKSKFSHLDTEIAEIFLRQMPTELTGKRALLSDASIGIVKYIDIFNYEFPIVDVDGEIIPTDNSKKILRMVV